MFSELPHRACTDHESKRVMSALDVPPVAGGGNRSTRVREDEVGVVRESKEPGRIAFAARDLGHDFDHSDRYCRLRAGALPDHVKYGAEQLTILHTRHDQDR
ncbi:hypothetical protein [Bradyrhizobium japonicum]|uniref:hypothetical protein n=1 Tax=Bradyrhizobium japonicum TaxID=375 RepID=UPI0024C032C1|nr:hypothetical protein [Bradyrhizobium japonicum]